MQPKSKQTCSSVKTGQSKEEEDKALNDTLALIKHKYLVMSGQRGRGQNQCFRQPGNRPGRQGIQGGADGCVMCTVPMFRACWDLWEAMSMGAEGKLLPLRFNDKLKIVSIEGLMKNKDEAIIWRRTGEAFGHPPVCRRSRMGRIGFSCHRCASGYRATNRLPLRSSYRMAQAVIVTTPQEVALADVRKSISFCKTVHMGIAGLIENMSGCVCPKCGESFSLFGAGGGERTALTSGVRFLGSIPL